MKLQKEKLEAEGHTIVQKGRKNIRYYVKDYYPQLRESKKNMFSCILEKKISQTYDTVILDASLPAACLYENRAYKTVGHRIYELENDVKLVYEIMEKKLKSDENMICMRGVGK